MSNGLMCLAVQELSELTAKCKLAGTVTQRCEPELLGFQFHWHVQIYSADKREIKISLTDLIWQFASLRSGAPTVTNLLSSLSQTPHRSSQLRSIFGWSYILSLRYESFQTSAVVWDIFWTFMAPNLGGINTKAECRIKITVEVVQAGDRGSR